MATFLALQQTTELSDDNNNCRQMTTFLRVKQTTEPLADNKIRQMTTFLRVTASN
jgi:hypothetical protein